MRCPPPAPTPEQMVQQQLLPGGRLLRLGDRGGPVGVARGAADGQRRVCARASLNPAGR